MNTRKLQFWILIFLSAGTAFCQYIIQGTLAAGMSPTEFDQFFWTADQVLWGLRALIETWVVGYLFSTTAKKWYQQFPLLLFEILLLALIVFTLGPAFEALGTRQMVYEMLGSGFRGWAYAIAAYTSLMIAGAGTAYRIQPFDIKEEPAVIEKEGPIGATAVTEEELKEKLQGITGYGPQSGNGKITREEAIPLIVEEIKTTGSVNAAKFAKEHGVTRQSVANWIDFAAGKNIVIKLPGRGNYGIPEEMEVPQF